MRGQSFLGEEIRNAALYCPRTEIDGGRGKGGRDAALAQRPSAQLGDAGVAVPCPNQREAWDASASTPLTLRLSHASVQQARHILTAVVIPQPLSSTRHKCTHNSQLH